MRFFKIFSLFLAVGLWAVPSWADVSIETSVSTSRVAIGDQLTLDIIITNADGKISKPTISSIDGFSSYSQGHSQEISIINGQTTSRSVFSYVLIPNSVGKKTIGPFEISIGGKLFKVAPVQVEVVAASGPPVSSLASSQGPVSAPVSRAVPTEDVSDRDIFVQVWLDKDEVYVNEPAMLTYTLYTRLPATYKGFEKEPVTTGFWAEDFPPDKTVKRTEKILNNSRYVVADVRKISLFPTQAGVYSVDTGTLAANVEIRDNDPFDSFYSSNIFGRRPMASPFMSQMISKILPAKPVTITVKTLPEEGKPSGFGGAVGNYLMEGSVDKKEAQVGDPITYRIRVWGQGNLNTLQMPSFPKLEDFKIYDSSSSSNLSKDRLIVEGEKVAETVIVPKKPGNFTIPPVVFSYFDPKDKSYKVMKTDPQTLVVTGAPETEPENNPSSSGTGIEPAAQENVSVLAKDIRYLKASEKSSPISGKFFHRRAAYWGLNGLFLIVWILFGWLAIRKEGAVKESKGFRFRRSHAAAKGKLRAASKLLKEEKQEAFFEEVSRVVYSYFGEKLEVQSQSISVTLIEERTKDEASPELINQIRKMFDELSGARFSRSKKSHGEMKELYDLADKIITSFEKVKIK